MLRWVSKIQECIDAIEKNEKCELAEEHLKLTRDLMSKELKSETVSSNEDLDSITIEDSESLISDSGHIINPALSSLRNQLAIKYEQLWQFEVQIIDFLGRGKGDFKRNEFICATKQDYFLVPSRIETFIPAGTKVMIFGQLPYYDF